MVINANTYTQGASGALTLTLDSTEHGAYGRINASGTFTAGGTLTIANDGLPLNSATTFDVINGAEITGQFDDIQLPTPAAGYAWDLSALYTDGEIAIITVPGSISATPILWLDANDTGSPLLKMVWPSIQLIDKTGHANTTQLTETKKPTFTSGGFNGLNTINFDGSNELKFNDLPSHTSTSYSAYMVLKPSVIGNSDISFASGSGTARGYHRDPNLQYYASGDYGDSGSSQLRQTSR